MLDWSTEWGVLNAIRAYPFVEESSRTDITDSFRLPDDVILGIYIPTHSSLDVLAERFFLQRMTVTSGAIIFAIGYAPLSGDPVTVGVARALLDSHTEYQTYMIPGQGDFSDTSGQIQLGSPAALRAVAPGDYRFNYAATQLEVDGIWPSTVGLQSLVLTSSVGSTRRIYGDIELRASDNAAWEISTDPDDGHTIIKVHAIATAGLNADCICNDENLSPCIRTINGVGGDENRNLTLQGSDCISFLAIGGGLSVQDNCSKPCCGNEELTALANEVTKLGSNEASVRGLLNQLNIAITTLNNNILGSALRPSTCR